MDLLRRKLSLLLAVLLVVTLTCSPVFAARETDKNGVTFEFDPAAGILGIYGNDSVTLSYQYLWNFFSGLTGSSTMFRYSGGGSYIQITGRSPFSPGENVYTLGVGSYSVQTAVYETNSNGSAKHTWQDAAYFKVCTYDYLTVQCNMTVSGLTVNGVGAENGAVKVYRQEIYLNVPGSDGYSIEVSMSGRQLAAYGAGDGGMVVLNPLCGDAEVTVTYTAVPVETVPSEPAPTTEPTQDTVTTETTQATVATQPTQATAATQPTQGTVATQPTQGTVATEPTQGTVATQPAQGTVATQPTQGTVATEPTQGTVATQPTQGTVATQPTQGTVATQPTQGTVATQPTQCTVATEPTQGTVATQPTQATVAIQTTPPTVATQPTQWIQPPSSAPTAAATEGTRPAAATTGTVPMLPVPSEQTAPSATETLATAEMVSTTEPGAGEKPAQSDPFLLPALLATAGLVLLGAAAVWLYLRGPKRR